MSTWWKNKGASVQVSDSSQVRCFLFEIQEAGNESGKRAGSCRQLMASGNYVLRYFKGLSSQGRTYKRLTIPVRVGVVVSEDKK